MQKLRRKMKPLLRLGRKESIYFMVFCLFIFVVSISLLFVYEKKRLNKEYNTIIEETLTENLHHDVQGLKLSLDSVKKELMVAMNMFEDNQSDELKAFLAHQNQLNPSRRILYQKLEKQTDILQIIPAGTKAELARLREGQIVFSHPIYNEATNGHVINVVAPLMDDGKTHGFLYSQVDLSALLSKHMTNDTYKNVQSSIIDNQGVILYTSESKAAKETGNLYEVFPDLVIGKKDREQIHAMIDDEKKVSSVIFNRKNTSYFVSAMPITINDWYLVLSVRGSDVLLRSATIFKEIVRISIVAILITLSVACIVFLQLLFSNRRLEIEQIRNKRYASRLQAMFSQNNVLSTVIDIKTRRIIDVNDALTNYFGYPREEMIGKEISHFNLVERKVLDVQFEKMKKSSTEFLAVPHRLSDGSIKLLDVSTSVIDDGVEKFLYVILFDSTDREWYRSELFKEKEFLRITLNSIGDGVVTTDNQGRITGLNSVAEKLIGWSTEEVENQYFTDIVHLQNENTGEITSNPIQKVLSTGKTIGLANHTELINRYSEVIPITNSFAPIQSERGKTFGVVMVFHDMRLEKEHHRQIEFLSYYDELTGLFNRKYMENAIVKLAKKQESLAVIMIDVNGLKISNDIFGHETGDLVLKKVATILEETCSSRDLIARWGGDEFVILMKGKLLQDAENLVKQLKDITVFIEGSNLPLSLSFGCACTDSQTSIAMALQDAEKNMYQQKLLNGKSYRNAIISTLLATLYEKSNETEEHSKRLEEYCLAIGQRLQLSSKELDELSLLALLHDIGKVGIDANILKKPSALTDEEWVEMKRHPEVGYRIAQETADLESVADLILAHHERWDGKGYPHQLKGEEIPLACRILSVVDSFDAMTNDRVYRQAMTTEEAVAEIKRSSGTQFDPKIVEHFIHVLEERKE
uniref:HD domain-containing phosphohydrolase n=1 Tax=Candidatus Enterococcus willemsii TaxID=1857215 RepID=UPI00403F9A7E